GAQRVSLAGRHHHRSSKDPLMNSQPAARDMTQSQAGSAFDIRDYWKIVRGGLWTILAVFTIVVGLVALWTFTQTPVYKASLTISMSGTDPRRITEIVNTVADEYVSRNMEKAKQGIKLLLAEMNKQVEEFSKSTELAEKKRFGEAEAPKLIVPESQQDVLGKQ